MTDDGRETTYRIYKRLPSGEWHPWATRMDDEDYAREHLEALREESGEFRLAKFEAVREWLDA